MKKLIHCSALILTLLLCATACATTDVPDDGQVVDSAANKKLTISVAKDTLGYYSYAIEGFKAVRPDVEIELHSYDGDHQKYRQQVRTQLMAGQADDLLSYVGFNDQKLLDSGLIADFYPIMQNDPDFNEADYFMSAIDGFSYKNKLPIFPLNFVYWGISVNDSFSPELTEKFKYHDKITFREVFDLYNNLENKNKYYVSESMDALTALKRNINTFVDFENKKCYFNTPEFIEFLSAAKNATDPQKIADGYLEYTFGVSDYDEMKQNELALKYLFCDELIYVYHYFATDYQEKKFAYYIPLVQENGALIIETSVAFIINEASKNKELAWEFVKYLTTMDMQGYTYNFAFVLPIHRQMFRAYVDDEWQRLKEDYLGEFEQRETGEQVRARLEGYNDMPMSFPMYLDFDAVKEIIQSFYDGVLTAEQTANELQNKVSIYLME